MPELTWTTALASVGVLTGAAAVAGVIVAVVGHRTSKAMDAETAATLKGMHATTQETLTQMEATTQETLRQLGTGITTMDTGLKTILDRIDREAEQRAEALKALRP
jgi:hypothetical protein